MLYVEPPRSPLWRVRRAPTQSNERAGPPREVQLNLWVLTMPAVFAPMALYRHMPWLRRWNNRLMGRYVRAASDELALIDPVAWIYLITYQGAPILKDAPLSVYDCIDEWAGGTEDPSLQRFFAGLDERLCRESDVLFAGSRLLAEARRELNTCQRLVPQGVDLAHFLPPRPGTPRPEDLAALPRPVLGLVGVLNRERVDVPLLCRLAAAHREGSIALVGPAWEGLDVATLARQPNIHLLGNKPRESLGAYLAGFDVCLLPYLINDFTRNIFPLKLFEYLASGKPFVSTAVPACSEFPRLIRVAHSHEEFVRAVDEALREDDAELRAERIALARQNDWDRRMRDKARFVAQELERRTARQDGAQWRGVAP